MPSHPVPVLTEHHLTAVLDAVATAPNPEPLRELARALVRALADAGVQRVEAQLRAADLARYDAAAAAARAAGPDLAVAQLVLTGLTVARLTGTPSLAACERGTQDLLALLALDAELTLTPEEAVLLDAVFNDGLRHAQANAAPEDFALAHARVEALRARLYRTFSVAGPEARA